MDWESIGSIVWTAINSPAGITALAGVVLWALNKLYAAKPAWKKYEGTLIRAIKYAEKEIPDDTDNKAAKRFDTALQFIIRVIQAKEQRTVSPKELSEIEEGIHLKHSEMEAVGTLSKDES